MCLAEKKIEDLAQLKDRIDFDIAMHLQTQSYNLDELVNKIVVGNETDRIERIRDLLDAGKIKSDGKRYYI